MIAVFDFDGVIVNGNGEMSSDVADLIAWYRSVGTRVVVVTGRSGGRVDEAREWLYEHDVALAESLIGSPRHDDAVAHKTRVAQLFARDLVAWYDDDRDALRSISASVPTAGVWLVANQPAQSGMTQESYSIN